MEELRIMRGVTVIIDDFDQTVYLKENTPVAVIQKVRTICDRHGYQIVFQGGVS